MRNFFYETATGRVLLKPLTSRRVSRVCGRYMDSVLSRPLIKPFVRKNGIDMSQYESVRYRTFNSFFTRDVRAECRPFDMRENMLVSPCDGRLSAYKINEDSLFRIKNSLYSIDSLLGGAPEQEMFGGGICLVFRLSVDDYHRYRYFDSGVKGENHFIPGVLHTVRPIALENTDVFVQNCREYTVMETDHFGTAVQVEVGAVLVGRIENHSGACRFERGTEKGLFLYGGSTIVLLLQKDAAEIPAGLFADTEKGIEKRVLCGEAIGVRK